MCSAEGTHLVDSGEHLLGNGGAHLDAVGAVGEDLRLHNGNQAVRLTDRGVARQAVSVLQSQINAHKLGSGMSAQTGGSEPLLSSGLQAVRLAHDECSMPQPFYGPPEKTCHAHSSWQSTAPGERGLATCNCSC